MRKPYFLEEYKLVDGLRWRICATIHGKWFKKGRTSINLRSIGYDSQEDAETELRYGMQVSCTLLRRLPELITRLATS